MPFDFDWIAVFVSEFHANFLLTAVGCPFVRVERHATDHGRPIQYPPNIRCTHQFADALTDETYFGGCSVDNDHIVVIGCTAFRRGTTIGVDWLNDDVITSRLEQLEIVDERTVSSVSDRG
jgi:hypothetical protein